MILIYSVEHQTIYFIKSIEVYDGKMFESFTAWNILWHVYI